MNRLLLRSVVLSLATLLVACSSFDKQWNDAARGKSGATRWDGRWASSVRHQSNGSPHGGRLRCVLEPRPDKSLTAHFHANWLIFSGNYDVSLKPVPAGPRAQNVHRYQGTHDLPSMFGGTYHYGATIVGNRFTACYQSSYDDGTFNLRRVPLDKENKESRAQH